jgi:tetratricopeptide (TPR) repeat protein
MLKKNDVTVAEAYQMLKDAGSDLEDAVNLGMFDVREAEEKYSRASAFYAVIYNKNEVETMRAGISQREKTAEMKILEEKVEKTKKELEIANTDYIRAFKLRQDAQTKWEHQVLLWETAKNVPKGRLHESEAEYQKAQRWENENLEIVKVKQTGYDYALDALDITTRFRKAEKDFRKALDYYDEMWAKSDSAEQEFEMNKLVMGPRYGELMDAARQAMRDKENANLKKEEAAQLLNVREGEYVAFFNQADMSTGGFRAAAKEVAE